MSSFYSGASSKSRRSPPGEPQSAFFQTGQGGRTVLPPLSSAFPTSRFPGPAYSSQYTPRSSPGRYAGDPSNIYSQSWAEGISPDPTASLGNYETHDRYSSQVYTYPSRSSPGIGSDDRKLPPLNTSSAAWSNYVPSSSGYQATGGSLRSPTASYPAGYDYSNHGGAYSYQLHGQDSIMGHGMGHSNQISSFSGAEYPRSTSPYGNNRSTQPMTARSGTPPPISPVSGTEESNTIKKKRKRADANQLKVLNETYSKTAFPSTEERQRLAKQLDMSPRSVQIWFQNKRQSMRQTQRQSSTAGTSIQPHVGGQEPVEDRTQNYHATSIPLIDSAYQTRHSSDAYKHPSMSSSHRHVRQHDDVDPRKWAGY